MVIGGADGELIFLNLCDPKTPKVLNAIRLIDQPINHIRFSSRGMFILAGNLTTGMFFVLTVINWFSKCLKLVTDDSRDCIS